MAKTIASESLLERLSRTIELSGGVDFTVPQDTGWFSIEDDLIEKIRVVIHDTATLASDIMDFFDDGEESRPEPDPEFDGDDTSGLIQIGAKISSELATREISDLAFVCRGQLLEILEALEGAVERKEIWLVASHADTGLRRATKGLITLEAAIREYEGLPALERNWIDLEDSLEIRRLYGQFRRAVLRPMPEDHRALRMHLRKAATRIAILRDLKIYPLLRIDDRLEIRSLQKRILAWMSGDGDSSEDAGRRLWTDLVSFARLLVQVNNREEIREHDRRVVSHLYHVLFLGAEPPDRLPTAVVEDLESLLGRDDELDQAILKRNELPVETLRDPLVRLRKELGQAVRRPGL